MRSLPGARPKPRLNVCSLQCLTDTCTAAQATDCATPAALPRTGLHPWTSALMGTWMPRCSESCTQIPHQGKEAEWGRGPERAGLWAGLPRPPGKPLHPRWENMDKPLLSGRGSPSRPSSPSVCASKTPVTSTGTGIFVSKSHCAHQVALSHWGILAWGASESHPASHTQAHHHHHQSGSGDPQALQTALSSPSLFTLYPSVPKGWGRGKLAGGWVLFCPPATGSEGPWDSFLTLEGPLGGDLRRRSV